MTVSGHVFSPLHLFPRYSCVLVMPHIVCRHRVSNEARHARRPYFRLSFSDLYRHRRDRASRLFRGVAGFPSPEMVSALHAPRGRSGRACGDARPLAVGNGGRPPRGGGGLVVFGGRGRGPRGGGAIVLSGARGRGSPRASSVLGASGAGRKAASPAGLGEAVVGLGCASPDRALAR